MGRSHQAQGIWLLHHCINTKKTVKYLAKYELRKQLAETLILSKLVEFAAARFVPGHYVKNFRDVLKSP